MNLNERELDRMADALLADLLHHEARCDSCGAAVDAREAMLRPGDDALGTPDLIQCLDCWFGDGAEGDPRCQ